MMDRASIFIMTISPVCISYSEAIQAPVALLRREHVLYLRQSLKIKEHTIRNFYHFTMREHVGEAGYQRWASGIQTRHGQVAKYT